MSAAAQRAQHAEGGTRGERSDRSTDETPVMEPTREMLICFLLRKYAAIRKSGNVLSNKRGSPCGSAGKESACKARDLSVIPGWGRSPGEGKGYPLQYSCLGDPMERGA